MLFVFHWNLYFYKPVALAVMANNFQAFHFTKNVSKISTAEVIKKFS